MCCVKKKKKRHLAYIVHNTCPAQFPGWNAGNESPCRLVIRMYSGPECKLTTAFQKRHNISANRRTIQKKLVKHNYISENGLVFQITERQIKGETTLLGCDYAESSPTFSVIGNVVMFNQQGLCTYSYVNLIDISHQVLYWKWRRWWWSHRRDKPVTAECFSAVFLCNCDARD